MIVSILLAAACAAGYPDAEEADWGDVRLAAVPTGKAQLSVHVPLNLLEPESLVYCDCAFNAWKLAMPADLKMYDAADKARIDALHVGHLGIAVGEQPFLPDYRQTRWTRRKGGIPAVRGEFEAIRRRYVFEYCVNPGNGELYVRGTVKNTGDAKGLGVVRIRRAEPLESDILDYHYVGFRWNAAKWSTGGVVDPPVCTAHDAGSTATRESSWIQEAEANPRVKGFWGSPYTPEESMRLFKCCPVLKLEAELEPGAEFSFTVAAGFADGTVARHPSFDETLAAADGYWTKTLDVKADFGDERVNDVFRNLQYLDRQALVNVWKDPEVRRLQPCQGGTSERFFVWTWEAMSALMPLVRLGHAEAIGKVLEYFIGLQDGASPPEGDFTTVKGAIGTTGPRWANSTGSALLLASAYLEANPDADFGRRHLGDLVRAAEWIVGETAATTNGLLPGCVVNDGDKGVFYATTDTWTYAGLRRFAMLLARFGHPDAKRLASAADRYLAALDRAVDEARRPDGFILRCLGSDVGGSFEFRNIPGAFGCIYSGMVDPVKDERFARMVDLWERTHARGLFLEPFDGGINYIGTAEAGLNRWHLQRGEWKKAYLTRETAMNYAMTPDLAVTSERYSEVDDSFTPWQPNSSGAGRVLGMMIDRFLCEGSSRLVLLGGFAPFETKGPLSIEGLRTACGRCAISCADGRLSAVWERPLPEGTLIVIPAHFGFVPDGDALVRTAPETWKLVRSAFEIKGKTGDRRKVP